MLRLTCLMDNMQSENKALRAEHGLSVFVETEDARFLFDCGPGESTIFNAHKLGVDLAGVAFTVCSHNHYDHAAGFRDLAERGMGGGVLWTGEGFWEPKYAALPPKYTDLSCGFDEAFLRARGVEHRVCCGLGEILPGVWAVTDFARTHAFETIPGKFMKGPLERPVPDSFSDEICLAIDTAEGVVMLVGCSHPGILNMAETVRARLHKPIRGIFGGTHLMEADEARIQSTICALKEMGLTILGLSHCSGEAAEKIALRDASVPCCHLAVGDRIPL